MVTNMFLIFIQGSITTGCGSPVINLPHNHVPDMHAVALARCRGILITEPYPPGHVPTEETSIPNEPEIILVDNQGTISFLSVLFRCTYLSITNI